MKTIKTIILLLLISASGYAQVSVTSYSIYAFSASVPVSKKFDTELKIFTNKGMIENTSFELNGMYKFKSREFHQFSSGLGFGVTPSSGESAFFSIPVAFEFWPIQTFKRLSILFEAAPEIYFNDDNVNLRHLWGIRYTFTRNSEN